MNLVSTKRRVKELICSHSNRTKANRIIYERILDTCCAKPARTNEHRQLG